jgi:hypothetical protein
MPKRPANIEQMAPPPKATPVQMPKKRANMQKTTTMKRVTIWYSRLRNTIAPWWIASAISTMVVLPGGRRFTLA